jgi:large subunit ribosomal protein L25
LKFIDLNATKRTGKGNSPARQLRLKGLVPAVIYGPGKAPEMLSVNSRDLERVFKGSHTIQVLVNLNIENGGSETRKVMIKDLQTDPVSRQMLHVDFYEIDPSRKIHMKVQVVAKGKAAGVEMGGMIQIIRRELEVLCLPGEIPDTIELDVTGLGIGDSIHVKDIHLEGNLEIPAEVDFTVITCLGKRVEAEGGEGGEGADEVAAEVGKTEAAE